MVNSMTLLEQVMSILSVKDMQKFPSDLSFYRFNGNQLEEYVLERFAWKPSTDLGKILERIKT